MTVELLLVDDHKMVRECLRSALEHHHLKVLGEASHGDEALQKIKTLQPTLILLNLDSPTVVAFSTLERIQRDSPTSRVIVITSEKNPDYVFRAFQLGAMAYVLQEGSTQELLSAIEAVRLGKSYINPILAGELLRAKRMDKVATKEATTTLSSREREVLTHIARGQTSKDIAKDLRLSVRTIQTHRERMMRKLDIHTVAGLTRYALDHSIDGEEP